MKKLLMLILFITNSFIVGQNWEVVGQGGGGNIVDVITHPADPNILWVVTDLTGIFKSTNGGNSFDRMSGDVEREEEFFEWMRAMDDELAYDPTDPNIMYWAVDGGIYKTPGLYKSTNGGENWFKIPGSPDLSPGVIAVDNKGVIYGVKHKNMYVSKDKGTTWEQKPDVLTYYCGNEYDWRRRYRIYMYVTPEGNVIIGDRYEGTGFFISNNQGDSWKNVLPGMQIMDIASSPVTPGLIVALEQDGRIFRSSDEGKSFITADSIRSSYYRWGTWPAYYGAIEISSEDHIMAIGRYELGISTDGGLTFSKLAQKDCGWDPEDYIFTHRKDKKTLFKCNKLASSISGEWYFVDGSIVKKSMDNGRSWVAKCKGIDILCVYSPPVIDISDPAIIHIAAGDNGHHYSTNSGITWTSSEERMGNIDGICQDPNNPKIYYKMKGRTRDRGAFLKSTDGGQSWEKLTNIPLPGINGRTEQNRSFYTGWIGKIVVDPTNSDRIYATHRGSDGVYMSEDGGFNFRRIIELVRPWQLEVTRNGTVFVCTWDSEGLFRSSDNGKSFKMISGKKVHDFAVNPENENIIYFNEGAFEHAWATANILPNYERNRPHGDTGKGCLYKTVNGGEYWEMLGDYDGFALYIEPNYPNVMLMSTRDGGEGIMRSMDGGKSWQSIHGDHNNYHPRGFVYGGIPGRVYSWNHNLERINNIHKVDFRK